MSKNSPALVIVESAAKAKTINKFLGKNYVVRASLGHVRDLPKKEMGIDIEHGFTPKYVVIRGRGKTLSQLKSEALKASKVYLAPDCDREGEAIAWHLAEYLNLPEDKTLRVTFNEITERAIKKAFLEPSSISMDKVNAQQARRILDRIVGYHLSPLLWKKFWKGLSAGRVQSVAVKLVVEREKEIREFKPEEYWEIAVALEPESQLGRQFAAELKKIRGEDFRIPNETEAKKAADAIRASTPVVDKIEKKEKLDRPQGPFATSTMQAAASNQLRFSAAKTMVIAQQLYEGVDLGEEGPAGLITYMRTDSQNIAQDAITEVRAYIGEKLGKDYLPPEPNRFKSRKLAQEAHEAVRPTSVLRTPDSIKQYLTGDQHALYVLIWERFVACQMAPAVYDVTTIDVLAGDYLLRASGRVTRFPGHLAIIGTGNKKDDVELPGVREGEPCKALSVEPSRHFTQPPDRYTEASLVRILEKEGIGRPSTYAPILSTIVQRGYVELRDRKFFATELGILITDRLVKHFPKIMDTEFTAHLEEELDDIEEGKIDYKKVLDEFYGVFSESLKAASKEMRGINETPEIVPDEKCDKCGSNMVYKYNKRGKFIGCSNFPKCKNTRTTDSAEKAPDEMTDEVCPKCTSPMVVRTGRFGKFLACSTYPKCKYTRSIGEAAKKQAESAEAVETSAPTRKCPKCGADMVVKHGPRGAFLACGAFPKCRTTSDLPSAEPETVNEKCPNCGSPMAVKSGRRGKFLACTAYPACRTTRPLPGREAKPAEPAGMNCDKCGKAMVIRTGRGGVKFAACTGYPKCRNTRSLTQAGKVLEVEEVLGKCEECGSELVVKYGARGKFLACTAYPKCKNTQSFPGES
jgi:DNA topoisomerase-1